MSGDRLVNPPEVAKRLDVCPNTVRAWCRAGLIAHVVMPSGRIKVPIEEIERLCKTMVKAGS